MHTHKFLIIDEIGYLPMNREQASRAKQLKHSDGEEPFSFGSARLGGGAYFDQLQKLYWIDRFGQVRVESRLRRAAAVFGQAVTGKADGAHTDGDLRQR